MAMANSTVDKVVGLIPVAIAAKIATDVLQDDSRRRRAPKDFRF